MSQNKKAYFQGGGGVNEPTPKKKKYKSDPAIVMQTRFKEPFYRNYDLYNVPGFEHIGPGAGWHHMDKYDSVQDFLKDKRKKMKDKYKADDSWQLDDGTRTKKNPNIKARAALLNRIMKLADNIMMPKEHGTSIYDWKNSPYQGIPKAPKKHDSNDIDFPIDDQIESGPILGDSGSYSDSVPIGGASDEYLPLNDFEGKSPDKLDFGRDYTSDCSDKDISYNEGRDAYYCKRCGKKGFNGPYEPKPTVEELHSGKDYTLDDNLDELEKKYLKPAEPALYGLPDGISPPEDLDAPSNENPQYGETDSGNTLYDQMWI